MKLFSAEADGGKIMGIPTFIVRDKNGNKKQLWNANAFGRFIMKFLRLFLSPIGSDGQVKPGMFHRFAAYGIRIAPFGFWADSLTIQNLVTNAGFAGMASRCNGAGSEAAFTYLEVGTGTTAAAAGNTTLETAITDSGLARAAATCTRVTTTQTNDTAQLDKTWTVTGTKAITEVGALNASSAGVLLGRQVFSAINVVNGDTLQILYKFKFS